MSLAKPKASNIADVMKPEEGCDSLDTFAGLAKRKDHFLRASESPEQWIQLLRALDLQEIRSWPSLTPMKVQMQKCDKCSQEFCSSINYRRHIRVHHRLKKLDKDFTKNRDLLGAFWDKLSEDEAKEILSFKDVMLEEVPGSSILKSLTCLIGKPGFPSLPQNYFMAGSILLDIIQARPSRFPLSSEELFCVLDDASEKTFLCGTAITMQKFVFDGEAGKIGLETRNLVACTSFLVEQKLVKAWLAEKDVEALRCQEMLVEEEEAAQRRQAELLERKRQKKLRQKEQKAKEQRQEESDVKVHPDDTLEAMPSIEKSNPSAASDSDTHGIETPPDEDLDLETQTGSGNGYSDQDTGHNVELETAQGNSHRHTVVARWNMPPKSQWNCLPNGFHGSQNSLAPKFSPTQRRGVHRDLKPLPVMNGNRKWSRKPKPEYNEESLKPRGKNEATNQPDHNKHKVLIGSISITLGNCNNHEGDNLDGTRDDCLPEHQMPQKKKGQDKHNRPDSVQGGTHRLTVKLWRPISHNGTTMLVENGTREPPLDGIANNDGRIWNRSPLLEESLHPGSLQFASQAAKAFLAERWKETNASQHVKLVLLPDSEPLG